MNEVFCEGCFYYSDDEDGYCSLFDVMVEPTATHDCDEKLISKDDD